MLYSHYSQVKPEHWPYRFFVPQELASKGDGSLLVVHDAIARLDAMREAVGKPFIITSAYRDPLHNARVGGAPRSYHKQGRAFDIALRGHDKDALRRAAEQAGFGGIAFANSFIHVDTGPRRTWSY